MHFGVLGTLQIVGDDGEDLTPSAPKIRQLLALLLLRNNDVVPVSAIVTELWGAESPASALQVVQTYVYKLRGKIREGQGGDGCGGVTTEPGGYRLSVPPENVDICRFRRYVHESARMLESDPERASWLLLEALRLWRGRPLFDVGTGVLTAAHVTELDELMLTAREMRLQLDLKFGRHTTLISELRSLIVDYPFNERLYGNLMLALYRSQRRFEALQTYQRLRQVVQDELGLEPAAEIQRLHLRILNSDPGLSAGAPEPWPTEPTAPPGGAGEWRGGSDIGGIGAGSMSSSRSAR